MPRAPVRLAPEDTFSYHVPFIHLPWFHVSPVRFTLRLAILLMLCGSHLSAQVERYDFFHPYPYGSDGLYNPLTLVANGMFDSYQILDREPAFNAMYWNEATHNVWRSTVAPLPVINAFGWNRFLRQEVFPMSLNVNDAQYVPNIMLHTIGGGMEYRKISEWYDYYGVPAPWACGILTCVAYEYLNEVVENGPVTSPNEDCIPDMLIFQPLGFLLFSFDDVSHFFSRTLNMNDWSEPVAFSFHPFALRNAGQNFVMKLPLDEHRSTSLFFHFGEFAIFGLTLRTGDEYAFSFGAGMASTGIKDLPEQNGVPSNTVTSGPTAGVYYDRNNSLMASMVYSANWNTRFRLCLYPGLLGESAFSPGMFVSVTGNGTMVAGVVLRVVGIGIGMKGR